MKAKRLWQTVMAVVILGLAAPVPRMAAAGPNKWAVLVGINNYKYPTVVSPLAGSINDVEDMRQVLTTKFEFPAANIKVLKNDQATHNNIIAALRDMIAKAKPGDIVVFHYSGHGSQMTDVTHKQISGLDETIVPYDSRDPQGKIFDISGAELHGLLLQLTKKTQNVTFILDSCHSGTLVRDIGATVRSVAADKRTPPPAVPDYAVATGRGLGQTDDKTPLKYAFIAAATSEESAYEHNIQGKEHGALTYFLAQQLRAAKGGATYRDVMDSVISNVSGNYPLQHPQLEGAEADQHIFGDAGSLAGSYVEVLEVAGSKVTLAAGGVQGATVGSVYDVYPPGSKKFAPPDQPVAKVRLTKVDDFSSEGDALPGGKVAPSSRAVERQHRYASAAMAVYIDGADSSQALKNIRSALQSLKYISIVTNRKACHVQLKQVEAGVELLAPDSAVLSPPFDASNKAGVNHVVEEVKSWAKYFNVLSIRNAGAGIDVLFTLKAGQTRDPMAHVGKADVAVVEGQKIVATLQNNADRDLYIVILDLSSDGSISVVYPTEQGAKEVLTKGSILTRDFTASVAPGHTQVRDILKVFASYKPIDLSPLQQGGIRGAEIETGPPDPLQALLNDSTGTRSLAPADSTSLGTWTTVQKMLVIKKKS